MTLQNRFLAFCDSRYYWPIMIGVLAGTLLFTAWSLRPIKTLHPFTADCGATPALSPK